MINLLHLTNFKAFQNQSFAFKPLTLLSGINSSGKSSVLQSLLLLRQSYSQGLLPNKGLALNGDLVEIGKGKDAFCEAGKENLICFKVSWTNGIEGLWEFNYNSGSDVLNIASEPDSASAPAGLRAVYQQSLFNNDFHYLQAERMGPRSYNKMSDYQVQQLNQIGTRGEYAGHFLAVNERKVIQPKLNHAQIKTVKSGVNEQSVKESLDLIDQVSAWMGEISPGTRLKINSNSDVDLVNIQFSFKDSNNYRATNVGFGLAYTLPIIVAVLSSAPGTLLLIENPEAHLHPKGQSQMGRLLALAASAGVQVVIETHSDHVLNGIRLTVHGGMLDPKDVQLHYFQRQQGITEIISPRIDRNGRIDRWPDGFFDEWDNSLEVLLEPAVEGV